MTWTLSQSGSALFTRAGEGADVDKLSGSDVLNRWSDEAESTLSTRTRKDWVADYTTITTNYKQVLSDVVSDMIALKIASSNRNNYLSRASWQTILNVLNDNITQITNDLKNDNIKEKMK